MKPRFLFEEALYLDPILQRARLDVVRKHDVEYTGNKDEFIIKDRPVMYYWASYDVIIDIPEGTITNFASLPAIVRMGNPVNSLHRYPALLHDYLYSCGGKVTISNALDLGGGQFHIVDAEPFVLEYSRSDADMEFKRFMLFEGVHRYRANYMHKAVSWCGGRHRKKTSPDKKAWLV
jgi:hypothetical protein